MSRLPVLKTLKMYAGGKFIRSESGRTITTTSARGERMYVCRASRKDLRNTVRIARAAQHGWEARSAYNRGQILYRLAEMIEDRRDSFPTGKADVDAAADRAVHHAGWADKATAVLSSINPVATGHINYAMVRGMGIIVALPSTRDGLTGLVDAACAATLMGNSVIMLVPTEAAEVAIAFAEGLATCDMPAGVVNVLTGDVADVLQWADKHDDIDALFVYDGAIEADRFVESQQHAARVLRRVITRPNAKTPAPLATLSQLAETKTVWMSS